MIGLPAGTKVFLACQPIDLRAGFDGLAAKVQQIIGVDPFSGHVFIFRSKRGHYLKGLYWDGSARRTARGPALGGLMTDAPSTRSERRTRFLDRLQREPTPPVGVRSAGTRCTPAFSMLRRRR